MAGKPNRTVRDALADLHVELTKDLTKRLKRKDGATAAELSVIRQFLKDNGIDALNEPGSPINELASNLPFSGEKDLQEDDLY